MPAVKTENPRISVIVPVYNVGRYLSQCLESVIHQTYRNTEIIIIDDGSTDDCAAICDRYAGFDPRVRVIHTENQGLAAARNKGLENAAGSYISFVDSDDWIELHTIETLLKTAVRTGADIAAGKRFSEYVGKTACPRVMKGQVKVFHGKDILSAYTEGLFDETVWNKLYRSECLKGIVFPNGHNYEDVFTTWKLMKDLASKDKTVALLEEPLFHFRMRRSSISHFMSADNIIDSWNAYSGRLRALRDYQHRLLPSCLKIIGRTWGVYCSLSREEKEKVRRTMLGMKVFSRRYFRQVMTGKYPLRTKVICLGSQSSGPIVLRFSSFLYKLREKIRSKRYRMYD